MQEYQDRVISEYRELNTKVIKLTQFIESDQFSKLSLKEQSRLKHQVFHMECYSDILACRISDFS